jgi:hypothetical protein
MSGEKQATNSATAERMLVALLASWLAQTG